MTDVDGITPDGRYLVVRGRLWRRSNPGLPEAERARLVSDLMAARRDKGAAVRVGDVEARKAARRRVDVAKVDACCAAWNALMAMPDRISSIATRDWAWVNL